MFDTSIVWAAVLKGLREKGENVLHGACCELDDIEFTANEINITTCDDSIFLMLTKYLKTLNGFAGGDYITVRRQKTAMADNAKMDRLNKLFGDTISYE